MKRSEQKEARRNEILMCAMNLFIKKGYAGTKISDIAEAANMSVGLLFHYFDNKETLYYELVRMGVEESRYPELVDGLSPDAAFERFLESLFTFCAEQPWVFKMFVLIGRAQQEGAPPRVRELANSIDQIESSAKVIEEGQKLGEFREGDPYSLSACFWASIQGIMEQMAIGAVSFEPSPDWLMAILRT